MDAPTIGSGSSTLGMEVVEVIWFIELGLTGSEPLDPGLSGARLIAPGLCGVGLFAPWWRWELRNDSSSLRSVGGAQNDFS